MSLLEHGGRLRQAAQEYGIALADWVDLSTGINPSVYPLPEIPGSVWQRLPEDDDGLEAVARAYYGAQHLLPLPGSQAAIQLLPRLRERGRVGVLAPCYREHPHAWSVAGHQVVELNAPSLDAQLDSLDVAVVVNPCNPTGLQLSAQQLREWHVRLASRGGWLVVDEAFADAQPEQSLAGDSHRAGLIVLRSLGKFFGLAGARVGFALAEPELIERLHQALGPWAVSGPSRWAAQAALADGGWHTRTRTRLKADGERLQGLLARYELAPNGATDLFSYVLTPRAPEISVAMAREGVLVRRFEEPAALRFGLPGSEHEWQRLEAALVCVQQQEIHHAV